MAVLSVNELIEGREAPLDEKGTRQYARVFEVTTSSNTDGPIQVRQATGIPRIGDVYATSNESDLGAYVVKIDPQSTENPKLWKVRVDYDSSTEEQEENPLDRPAEISWGVAKYTRAAYTDIDGHAILNPNGEILDPPIEMDDSRPILSIVRNEVAYNPSLAIDYQDAVNTDAFFGFSAGQVKVSSISATSQFENNIRFWRVTYEFELRREGWTAKTPCLGWKRRVLIGAGPATRLEQILIGGQAPAQPQPLDLQGYIIPNATPLTTPNLTFYVYKQRAFAALNLP